MGPLRHLVTVASPADVAFSVFTSGMGSWWEPADPDRAAYAGMTVEPRTGGAVLIGLGPEQRVVGAVTAWEPGVRYAQDLWLDMDTRHPTALEVHFRDVDGVCEVRLEHGGWGPGNAEARAVYHRWPDLLGRYAVACVRAAD